MELFTEKPEEMDIFTDLGRKLFFKQGKITRGFGKIKQSQIHTK